ncbi:MAG: YceD family protein [Gemmobacter sp.]
MTDDPPDAVLPWSHAWPLRQLPARKALHFDLVADDATRARIAAALGLIDLRALRLKGEIRPEGRNDLVLEGWLTAHAVQPCAVTLAPVHANIAEAVRRRFVADWQEPTGDEVELPEDTDSEPLPEVIDGGHVAVEALALALPLYPRAPGADLGEASFAPPGTAPLHDQDLRPFAGLAALKDRMAAPDEPGQDEGG